MYRYVVFNASGVLYFCTVNEDTVSAISENSAPGTRIASVPVDADESAWEMVEGEVVFTRKEQ